MPAAGASRPLFEQGQCHYIDTASGPLFEQGQCHYIDTACRHIYVVCFCCCPFFMCGVFSF